MVDIDSLLDSVLASDEHITVNTDRTVTVPKSLRKLGVYRDHDVHTITFDCPRYSSGRDMSLMSVYINGIRTDGETVDCPCENVRIDENDNLLMHFDWVITQDVTLAPGVFTFLVCIKKSDNEGNLANHYSSELCNDCFVSEGMDCQEPVITKYPDLIEHLLLRMNNTEKVAVTVDQANAVSQTASNAANTAVSAKNEAVTARDEAVNVASILGNTFANPLRKTVSGSVVKMDDVSPAVHDIQVKVRSKNLVTPFHTSYVSTNGEVTMSCEAGGQSITLHGNAVDNSGGRNSLRYYGASVNLEAGKTYTLTQTLKSGTVDGLYAVHITNSENLYSYGSVTKEGEAYTFTAEEDMTCHIGVNLQQNSIYENAVICYQVEEGDVATPYEEWADVTKVTVYGSGKNILTLPYYDGNVTRDGITATVREDGGVHLIGTATMPFFYRLANLPLGPGTILSGNSNGVFALTECTYDSANGFIYQHVPRGETVDKIVYSQVEYGAVKTEYEKPVTGQTVTPSEDGSCGISSISPITTLFTGVPGAYLEATYNRDTQKVVNDILERLTVLEGAA